MSNILILACVAAGWFLIGSLCFLLQYNTFVKRYTISEYSKNKKQLIACIIVYGLFGIMSLLVVTDGPNDTIRLPFKFKMKKN